MSLMPGNDGLVDTPNILGAGHICMIPPQMLVVRPVKAAEIRSDPARRYSLEQGASQKCARNMHEALCSGVDAMLFI